MSTPTFLVSKTNPLQTLEDLTKALNEVLRNSGRSSGEVQLDAPVVLELYQTELTDGSFVYDIKISEAA
jgi:hypothetical protein